MKYLCFTLVFLGVIGSTSAQLNSYKYIIIPKKFDIFQEENQFQTSVLIKSLFDKNGFNTVYEDDLPADLLNQRCLGAVVDLEKISSLLRTKVVILIKDCNTDVILSSPEGSSRDKDFKKAYHEAIRQAFIVFEAMEYYYQPKEEEQKREEGVITAKFDKDIRSVEEAENVSNASESSVIQVATPEEQSYKDMEPKPSTYVKAPENSTMDKEDPVDSSDSETLMAREQSNGFELLDKDEQVQITLFKTSAPDVYLAKTSSGDGMVYKKEAKWYFEYYKDSELVTRELQIQF